MSSNETKKLAAQFFQSSQRHGSLQRENLVKAVKDMDQTLPEKSSPSRSSSEIQAADLSTWADKLNSMPKRFDAMEKNELYQAWDNLVSLGNSTIWSRGHVALTLNRKYGEGTIKEFAEAKNVDKATIYRYIKLAELFPKVDKILEPTFYLRAIDISKGDNNKAVKMIEKAREKRKENPKYSVSQFVADMSDGLAKPESHKNMPTKTIILKLGDLIKQLKNAKDKDEYEKEIDQIKKQLSWLFE